jgi:predicted anti-sigma-YlaC factor YlaD
MNLLLEQYADQSLASSAGRKQVEEHLKFCRKCRDQLSTIYWTREIVRGGQLEEEVVPSAGFSRAVIHEIERQKEANLLWWPVRLIALQAIPVMTLLAVILGIFAYQQVNSLHQRQVTELLGMETYVGLLSNWGQEQMVLSDKVTQDRDRVVDVLMEGQSDVTLTERREKK